MEDSHFSIYCINFIHDRIDVLDSSPDDETAYHQVLGDRIIPRLNLLFQLATDCTIKQFTRFKHPIIDMADQPHDNDSGFFAIKFMELWNGESFHVQSSVKTSSCIGLSSSSMGYTTQSTLSRSFLLDLKHTGLACDHHGCSLLLSK